MENFFAKPLNLYDILTANHRFEVAKQNSRRIIFTTSKSQNYCLNPEEDNNSKKTQTNISANHWGSRHTRPLLERRALLCDKYISVSSRTRQPVIAQNMLLQLKKVPLLRHIPSQNARPSSPCRRTTQPATVLTEVLHRREIRNDPLDKLRRGVLRDDEGVVVIEVVDAGITRVVAPGRGGRRREHG